jgi:hypothetical protein
LPEIWPFTFRVGVSQEPACAVASSGLLVAAFEEPEYPTRAEPAPGAVVCDSLFRHTFILHRI